MQRTFSYIPTGHRLKIADLSKHEYFGEDLKSGKNTVAIFQTDEGALRAVWSYGNWNSYGLEVGDHATFKHTQSFREVEMRLVLITSKDCDVEGDIKIPQWTLK